MKQRQSLIQILRSNTFAIWISIASVIVQSFHTFFAFYKISSLNGTVWGIAQAVLFSIIVDAAILFYTVRKNTKVTWMAAFIMVIINLYVYYTHLGLSFDFVLGVLISFVIPVSNYFYSEEIEDEIMEVDYEPGVHKEILRQKEINQTLFAKNVDLLAELNEEKAKATTYITELREEIKNRNEIIVEFQNEKIAIMNDRALISQQPQTKGFANQKSPAQEGDKSLLNVMPNTDRPVRE